VIVTTASDRVDNLFLANLMAAADEFASILAVKFLSSQNLPAIYGLRRAQILTQPVWRG
jgi:hypothetical protein